MEPLLLGMLNTPEIIALLVLALILFGAKKLPELAKGLGHGIKEFRKASREISDELNSAMHEEPRTPPRRTSSTPSTPPAPEGTYPQYDEPSGEGEAAPDAAVGDAKPPSAGKDVGADEAPPVRQA